MGEVRIQVKLTNALDRALMRQGKMEPSEVSSYKADALVDTDAVSSVIPQM